MTDGDPVVLFGEGTSSDGNTVMPFRSALFGAVRDALGDGGRVHVQSVSVAYTRLHGLPMGRQFRSVAAWYGDIGLTKHFFRVVREGAIDVIVTFGPILSVDAGRRPQGAGARDRSLGAPHDGRSHWPAGSRFPAGPFPCPPKPDKREPWAKPASST